MDDKIATLDMVAGVVRRGPVSFPLADLNESYVFINAHPVSHHLPPNAFNDFIFLRANISDMMRTYHHFSKLHMLEITRRAGLQFERFVTKQAMLRSLNDEQIGRLQLTWQLKAGKPRHYGGLRPIPTTFYAARVGKRLRDESPTTEDNRVFPRAKYPPDADKDLVRQIIAEFQDATSNAKLERGVCGSCGESSALLDLRAISVDDVDFAVLQNRHVPIHLLPTTYSLVEYDRAILHPRGLSNRWVRQGEIFLCRLCKTSLAKGELPTLALANGFYYAFEHVPPDVQHAFKRATFVDRKLVARCSASKICFRYFDNPESRLFRQGADGMQRYYRGNVLILPQDNMSLHNLLPPPVDDIKDSFVVVFAGREAPTPETIRSIGPLKANANIVRTIIAFLLEHNPSYTCCTADFPTPAAFSQPHFDALFAGASDDGGGSVLLPSMEIGHVNLSDGQVAAESDSSSRNAFEFSDREENDFLVEASGYSAADRSTQSYRSMKAEALAHCLDKRGAFLLARRGGGAIQDLRNEHTLTWMFPHLDPFALGGFDDPRRRRPVSMQKQLRHLLRLADSPFQADPTFAFVFHSILQKRQSLRDALFRIPEGRHGEIVQNIRDVNIETLLNLARRLESDRWTKAVSEEERLAFRVLKKIHMLRKDVPGTDAYKSCRRNEMRSLIYSLGCPTFFFTLTPNDIDGLLCLMALSDYQNMDHQRSGTTRRTRFARAMQVAQNPAVVAQVFDETMQRFRDIVLRYGNGPGLFGVCSGFYGMVEAQGRGTLHCHMLIWVEGTPTPAALREQLRDEPFKRRMFQWLERLIKTELPGTLEVVSNSKAVLQRPRLGGDDIDPRTRQPPLISSLSAADFKAAFENHVSDLVYRNNWHEHRAGCWIHLKPGEPRTDDRCRMRMDGSTRALSSVDEDTGGILLRRLHPKINEYNDVIMYLFQCNMDLQFIGSGEGAKAAIFYITDYITKSSLKVHAGMSALIYAIEKNHEKYRDEVDVSDATQSRSLVNKMVNAMMSRQEMSHQQVMSYYVGGGDHYTSHCYAVLQWGRFNRLVATLEGTGLPAEGELDRGELGESVLDDEDFVAREANLTLSVLNGDVSIANQCQDYLLRPDDTAFDSLCLYDYVATVIKEVARAPSTDADLADSPEHAAGPHNKSGRRSAIKWQYQLTHPQRNTHQAKLRSTPVVPTVIGPPLSNRDGSDEDRSAWARAMMIMFAPWRVLRDLKTEEQSWNDAFLAHTFGPKHVKVMENMNVLRECKDARDLDLRDKRRHDAVNRIEVDDDDAMAEFEDHVLFDDHLEQNAAEEDATQHASVEEAVYCKSQSSCYNSAVAVGLLVNKSGECADQPLAASVQSFDVTTCSEEETMNLKRFADDVREWRKDKRPQRTQDEEGGALPQRDLPQSIITRAALPQTPSNIAQETSLAEGKAVIYAALEEVVAEYSLGENAEQMRALRLIGCHLAERQSQQLFLYIGGGAGTGKSHVIKSIEALFCKINLRNSLLLSAPTGAAAVLIGGYTIHALTLLPSQRGKKPNLSLLDSIWREVRWLVIDEISMVSALFLHEVSERICLAKGTSTDVAFGGVNVIYTGDFGQLKPFSALPLYSNRLVHNIGSRISQRAKGQSALNGALIWRQLDYAVLLRQNMRQAEDAQWADLLGRVRDGKARRITQGGDGKCAELSDYDVLRGRLLENLAQSDPGSVEEFLDAPIIVATRKLRDNLNLVLARMQAMRCNQTCRLYFSRDYLKRRLITGELRERLWQMDTRNTDAPPCIPLFIGMRVMLTENVAISKNLVNGTTGVVSGVRYETAENGVRIALAVYVHIEGRSLQHDGLPPNIVCIQPVRSTFTYTTSSFDGTTVNYTIARSHLPILPAYSYTDYKSQGRSLTRAIVDLAGCRSAQSAYVMLSRVRSLKGVAVLRHFGSHHINGQQPSELREEMNRLAYLDHFTTAKMHALAPASSRSCQDPPHVIT